MSNLDSRDIEERITELEETQEEMVEQLSNGEISESDMKAFDDEEGLELDSLRELKQDVSSNEWEHGLRLIHEDFFAEEMRELCDDVWGLGVDLPAYIADNIDWDGVTEDMKVDYSEVEYQGDTYYFRDC